MDTRDLSMRFGGVQAVNNVNFSLADRELRCLIGPNGAGKSTFFKCLTGQIRLDHSHGRVFIRGQDVTGWRAYEIVRLGVGIKTQVPSVMNGLTVEENLWLSARRVGTREQTQAAVAEVMQQMSLEAIARRLVGELAHGQRQLVEIGLVLAQRPWLLLLDEPAAGITGAEADQLVRIIHEVNRNATVVVVDHDMQFVRMLGGRVTVMHQGAILREGPVDEVLADAQGARGLHREPREMTEPESPIARQRYADAERTSDVVLDVAGLRAAYGHVPVLHGIDFQLQGRRGGRHRRPQRRRQDDVPEDADRPGADDRRPDLDRRHRRHAHEGARPQPPRHRLRAAGARHPARPDRAREPAPRVDCRFGRHRAGGDRARRRHAAPAQARSSTARAARSRAASSRSSPSVAR